MRRKGKEFKRGKQASQSDPQIPEYKKVAENKGFEKERPEGVRINKFIADAGVCSRREAEKHILEGLVKLNGKVVKELGVRVQKGDSVTFRGKELTRQKFVYVLFNKPKDCITTMSDPEGRKTVMDYLDGACNERIYPVGRLDRMTTGLLLLTNDGDLADRLAHPSNNIRKMYEVELDKPITEEHFEAVLKGLELEDGKAPVDDLAVVDDNGYVLGIEIHIGRNRIVRRIFEHLGYQILRLDRVLYAGLTKKDLPRGKWRYIKEMELVRLKGLKSKQAKKR